MCRIWAGVWPQRPGDLDRTSFPPTTVTWGNGGKVTTESDGQSRCSQCGALTAPSTEPCPQCGYDSVFDPRRGPELRQLSAIERVMLTMLYIEDRDTRWWDQPGRAIFLAAVAVVGYLLYLSVSVP